MPTSRSILALAIVGAMASVPAGPARAIQRRSADERAGVFEGRTPCDPVATEFTGFPAANCEQVKWRLTLYRDAAGRPTTYAFKGTRAARGGAWRIEHGAGPEHAWTVYRLADDEGNEVLSLLSVEDRVLLVLDRDLHVLVGDATRSYVLNRVDGAANRDRSR